MPNFLWYGTEKIQRIFCLALKLEFINYFVIESGVFCVNMVVKPTVSTH